MYVCVCVRARARVRACAWVCVRASVCVYVCVCVYVYVWDWTASLVVVATVVMGKGGRHLEPWTAGVHAPNVQADEDLDDIIASKNYTHTNVS